MRSIPVAIHPVVLERALPMFCGAQDRRLHVHSSNNRFIFIFNQLLNSVVACGRVPKQVGLRVVRRTLIRSDVGTSADR
jgi:hypothetical protein